MAPLRTRYSEILRKPKLENQLKETLFRELYEGSNGVYIVQPLSIRDVADIYEVSRTTIQGKYQMEVEKLRKLARGTLIDY